MPPGTGILALLARHRQRRERASLRKLVAMQIALVLFVMLAAFTGACFLARYLFRVCRSRRRHRAFRTAPGVHFSGAHDAGVPVDERAFAEIVRHLETSETAEPGDSGPG